MPSANLLSLRESFDAPGNGTSLSRRHPAIGLLLLRQRRRQSVQNRHFACLAAAAGLVVLALSKPATALTVVPTYDSTVGSNVNATAIENAFNYVCLQYANLYSDPINVNISVDVGTTGLGGSNTSILGTLTYAQTRSSMSGDATSAADTTAIANLPATDPTPAGSLFCFPRAETKALGLIPNDNTNDGTFTFNGNFAFTYDPANRAVAGKVDFIGVAEHEVSEIMGRIPSLGTNFFGQADYFPFDLFRFTAPGVRSLTAGNGNYFSIDSGTTNLKNFNFPNGNGSDPQDWASGFPDSYNAFGGTANEQDNITPVDVTAVDVIGYNLTNLVWNGQADHTTWNIFNTANWKNTNSNAATYTDAALVVFDDTNTNGNNIVLNQTVFPTSVTVNSSTNNYSISGTGAIAGLGSLTKSGTSTLTISTKNNYTGSTTVSNGTLTLTTSGTLATQSLAVANGALANINGLLTGTPATTVNGTLNLGANAMDGTNGAAGNILVRSVGALSVTGTLNVGAIGAASHTSRTALVAASLVNTGKIDLSNNDLIVKNTVADTLFNQLKSGFNAHVGYWDGASGIVSSSAHADTLFLTTIGYRQSPGGSFDTVSTSASDALVKYTYYGDADLSGAVDGADYHQLDLGFAGHLTGWSNGDFNYDGVVDGADYALIDETFNEIAATGAAPLAVLASEAALISSDAAGTAPFGETGFSPASISLDASSLQISGGQSVPEPSALGLLIAVGTFLSPRRRRTAH